MDDRVASVARVLTTRFDLLRALADGPVEKPALVAELGVSRSTVDRGMRELETHGLARRTDSQSRLTRFGEVVLEEFDSFVTSLDGLLEAQRIVESLSPEVPVSAAFFVGAEVLEPTQSAPYEPLERCLDDISRSDRIRIVTTVAVSRYAELFHEGLLSDATTAEVALPAEVVSRLIAERPAWFEAALESDAVALRELASTPPVTVALLGNEGAERAAMTSFDSDRVRGYVSNDTPEAVGWAREFIDRYWVDATPSRPHNVEPAGGRARCMFPPIEYVEWILPRIEAADHDLGSSDLAFEPATDDTVVPPRLADLPTPEASLEELVAETYGVLPGRVLVTAGASSANLLSVVTALALGEPGAEEGDDGTGPQRVLVEKPGYEPHVAGPLGFGATVDRFRRPRKEGWELDPGRVEGALTGATELVTVSNRHNPTGVASDRETLAACANAAREVGARLHVDEVYGPYGRLGEGPGFSGQSAAGLAGTVVTGSLTKFWGLGSLRIGWLVADEAFVERARQAAVHLADVAGPSRTLARRALGHRERLHDAARERCAANHDLLADFVEDRPDLQGVVADGSPFAFLAHASGDVDGDELAAAAWDAGVLVAPGRFFGAPEGVRVALGHPPAETEAALAAFGSVLDAL